MNIDEIRARAEAATEGPWVNSSYGGACILKHSHNQKDCDYRVNAYGPATDVFRSTLVVGEPWDRAKYEAAMIVGQWDYDEGGIRNLADATFIAHARQDIPALIARVDELEAEIEVLRINAEAIAKREADLSRRAALAMKAPAKPEYKQEDGG